MTIWSAILIYLSLGATLYLWSYYIYKNRIGEVPQYYSHPFVVILIMVAWPIIIFTSLTRKK